MTLKKLTLYQRLITQNHKKIQISGKTLNYHYIIPPIAHMEIMNMLL